MIIQVYDDDLLNGEGIREVVFLQGCPHHCKNCFNPETWEFKKETEETKVQDYKYYKKLYKKLKQNYISGITITGGDPLDSHNLLQTEKLAELAISLNKTVWIYTGFKFEDFIQNPFTENILNKIDVLCDGPFIESLKSPEKPWVGSSNQRVIDVKKSLVENKVILYDNNIN